MKVYPENKKTRFVCNFHWKISFWSVFRWTQRSITQRRVITLGPIFFKDGLKLSARLEEKKSWSFSAKNNNRLRYNKKCREGSPPPPALLGLRYCSSHTVPLMDQLRLTSLNLLFHILLLVLVCVQLINIFWLSQKHHGARSWGNTAFSVSDPRLWNSLPIKIRSCSSLASFKSILKTHLMNTAYGQNHV